MGDLIERLRALSRHEHDDLSIGDEAADEIERLQSDQRDSDALRERMAAILTDTANALKGEPEPLHVHSWHDLGEVAARVVAERDLFLKDVGAQQGTIGALKRKLVLAEADRDALRSRIEGALVVHDVTGKYGFVGKRVALVVIE